MLFLRRLIYFAELFLVCFRKLISVSVCSKTTQYCLRPWVCWSPLMWWSPLPPRHTEVTIQLSAVNAFVQYCPWLGLCLQTFRALGHHLFWKSHPLLFSHRCSGTWPHNLGLMEPEATEASTVRCFFPSFPHRSELAFPPFSRPV